MKLKIDELKEELQAKHEKFDDRLQDDELMANDLLDEAIDIINFQAKIMNLQDIYIEDKKSYTIYEEDSTPVSKGRVTLETQYKKMTSESYVLGFRTDINSEKSKTNIEINGMQTTDVMVVTKQLVDLLQSHLKVDKETLTKLMLEDI